MKLLFLGDFLFDYETYPQDFERICAFIKEHNYHLILNLETTWGQKGTPVRKRGTHLRSSPLLIEALHKLNVLAVCLANNHTMDFRSAALLDLKEQLTRASILQVGAGMNLAEACRPLQIPNTQIFIQNFAWDIEEAIYATKQSAGVAPLDRKSILKQTRYLKTQYPDSSIINVYHWGFEYNLLPMPLDIQFARHSIDAGADCVIGHHPHVMQPQETYKGKNIFYSLGNFYFGSRRQNYKKIFKQHIVPNACDFGHGVVWDTEQAKVCAVVSITYDKNKDASAISLCEFSDLEEMSFTNWNTRGYCKLAKSKSANFTPILTTNPVNNFIKLKLLNLAYMMAKLSKPIRLRFAKRQQNK